MPGLICARMRDVPAPLKRPAVFSSIKSRVPLRLTNKGLKPAAATSAAIVPTSGHGMMPPLPGAGMQAPMPPPMGMDALQVLQRMLASLQQPSNDGINLRMFPPRRSGSDVGRAAAPAGAAPLNDATAAPSAVEAEAAQPETAADKVLEEIETLAGGPKGKKLAAAPRKRPAASMRRPAAATPAVATPKKATPADSKSSKGTPPKTSPSKGKGKQSKGKGKGKQSKGKGNSSKSKGMMRLGCSKCRYAIKGCSTCKSPRFGGKRGCP